MNETYIKVNGIWCYLYRAVDKLGNNPFNFNKNSNCLQIIFDMI
ncbi:DDE-type integrase/transposase/recombinase [Flavobacterium flavipigmentatum]